MVKINRAFQTVFTNFLIIMFRTSCYIIYGTKRSSTIFKSKQIHSDSLNYQEAVESLYNNIIKSSRRGMQNSMQL